MHRTRLNAIWLAVVAVSAALGAACNGAPTEPASLNGVFQLAALNGQPLPIFVAIAVPDTAQIWIKAGALTLNASAHTYSYWYVARSSRGTTSDSERSDGLFIQSGSSIDFDTGVAPTTHFTGLILADTIVIANWNPAMKFHIPVP